MVSSKGVPIFGINMVRVIKFFTCTLFFHKNTPAYSTVFLVGFLQFFFIILGLFVRGRLGQPTDNKLQ